MSACDPPDRRVMPFPTPHGALSALADEADTYSHHAGVCLGRARDCLGDGELDQAHSFCVHARYHADGAIEAACLCDYYAACITHQAEQGLCEPVELTAMVQATNQAHSASAHAGGVKADLPGLEYAIRRAREAQSGSPCHA